MHFSLDVAFFLFFAFFCLSVIIFHALTAQHGIRRKGAVPASYWGAYSSSDAPTEHKPMVTPDGRIILPKPSDKLSTTTIGKAVPGAK